jgi:hypothetical protein
MKRTSSFFDGAGFLLSLCCFVISLSYHVASYFVTLNPSGLSVVIGIGLILLVLVPILVGRSFSRGQRLNVSDAGLIPKILFAVWLTYMSATYFYTTFALNQGGVPAMMNGQYVLANHGKVIRILELSEYVLHKNLEFRMQSAVGVLFGAFGLMEYGFRFRHKKNEPTGQA